jgi:hypothetical protein
MLFHSRLQIVTLIFLIKQEESLRESQFQPDRWLLRSFRKVFVIDHLKAKGTRPVKYPIVKLLRWSDIGFLRSIAIGSFFMLDSH